MRGKESPREVALPQFMSIFIHEEKDRYSAEQISEMLKDLLSSATNNNSFVTVYREILQENSDPDALESLRVMAVIHHSPLRDTCIQYSKEGKFGGHESGIHNFGEIMDLYRQLTNNL